MAISYTHLRRYVDALRRHRRHAPVLSIGDSWFQYPLRRYGDIQRKLATHFRNELLFMDDSDPGRDAEEVPRFVPSLARAAAYLDEELGRPFRLVLVSLGGNDVIGRDFEQHLKRAGDPPQGRQWKWNGDRPEVVRKHLLLQPLAATFERIGESYRAIANLRDSHAHGAPILCHTYADVTPSPKGYEFIGYQTGPWMWGPMRAVGLRDPGEQRELSRWLLTSFANFLHELGTGIGELVVLDTRRELSEYDGWWDNEIHPLGKGYKKLVDEHWAPEVGRWL
ncbi:MAG TPA: hypothetical protein VFG21_01340 [Xanthomonadaceae bacterium]|nr:hypothetical protein [Xanthomonadaceae bacterium]